MRRARTICVLPLLFAVPTLGQTSPPPPPPLDTCTGAMGTVIYDHVSGTPLGDIHLACGSDGERSPGTGKCASTACAALVGSFTDAKVELMARSFASCTGDVAFMYGRYADVDSLTTYSIKPAADECGLTAPFSPTPLDTCAGATTALFDFASACGSDGERSPDTGKCASTACAALVDSFTDANMELMARGFASCTGNDALWLGPYADADVGHLKTSLIKPAADECGLTAPFSPPAVSTRALVQLPLLIPTRHAAHGKNGRRSRAHAHQPRAPPSLTASPMRTWSS